MRYLRYVNTQNGHADIDECNEADTAERVGRGAPPNTVFGEDAGTASAHYASGNDSPSGYENNSFFEQI